MAVKNFALFIAFAAFLNTGCASLKSKSDINDLANQEAVDEPEVAHLPTGEAPSNEVNQKISQPYKSPLGEISLDRNKHSEMWIKYFQGRGRPHMEKYLERSARYLPMMKNVLRENGLPEDLVYIALIESGFSPIAHSKANAVGYWQFIRDTGRRYGLRNDQYIDERRDPVQSTRAAAAYFKALYDMLGSWHLSMAAYNTGENRVRRLVAKYNTRDFWTLLNKRGFYRETKHYVPKFIAAALIAKDPKAFGFEDIQYQPPLAYETISVPHAVSLKTLAEGMGTDLEELTLLNPKYRGDYVPLQDGQPVVLRVPTGKVGAATSTVIAMAEVKVPPIVKADYIYYSVRRGDNLGRIAQKHRTSIGNIRRLNNLGNRSFLRAGQRLKVPDRNYSQTYVTAQAAAAPETSSEAVNEPVEKESTDQVAVASPEATDKETPSEEEVVAYHVVRRGENLTLIARKYGVTIDALRKLNSLSARSVLRVGQRLILREADEENKSMESSNLPGASHLVSRGENLTLIAKRYGTTVAVLKRLNNLKSGHVMIGQKLKVIQPKVAKVAASAPVSKRTERSKNSQKVVLNKPFYHTVARGENLSTVAAKYNTSLNDLRELNRIRKNSVLFVGQKLKISNRTVRHTVKRGETLGAIAQKYKISIGQLVQANDMKSKKLVMAGQALIIPD